MEVKGKKISIIGAVRSGIAAAKLAQKLGAIPFVSDLKDESELKDFVSELKKLSIDYETGIHSDKIYDCDLMIVSPGVPLDSPVIKKAVEKKIKIISEIEFAFRVCKGKVIAITGTNGKTTTTSFCGHVFNHCGYNAFVAGNIGLAFSEIALDVQNNEFVVLEVSSFQLDLIDTFKPEVAVILNITPDHLNRYENSFEKYAVSKQRIYENQDSSDYLVLNKDDQTIEKYLKNHKSRSFYFSLNDEVENGCFTKDNKIYFRVKNKDRFTFNVNDLKLKGEHNLMNTMAVISVAKIFDINNEKLAKSLRTFEGVEHRLEFVREIDGVIFINDSKATNVDSVWYALRSFNQPILLILGGQDKGNDYNIIKELVIDRVKKIYAIGESADKIFSFFHKDVKVEIKSSMEDVVKSALRDARAGDVVLLSPACASFDMFKNYEHRGKVFKELVAKL